MDRATLDARAWQGISVIAVWLLLALIPSPLWVHPLVPIPSLVIAANALGPRPWFVRWGLRGSPQRGLLLSAAVVGIAFAFGAVALAEPRPTTDQPLTITCAARDLWHGVDPYLTYEPQCLAALHSLSTSVTPLERGPFATVTTYPSTSSLRRAIVHDQKNGSHAGFPAYGYPPEAALLILPVAFTGWTGISLWTLALSALLVAASWGRPERGKAVAFAWQMAGLALLWAAFRWNPEDLSYLLLALSFARIDRAKLSSVALAAAVCSNPLTWPAVPVYLAILARDRDRVTRWTWLAGGVAVGILPWMIWDHHLLTQLWTFVTLPEFPLGASLGVLAQLPSHSHLIYDVGLLAWIGTCTYLAWRWPRWRWSMVVLVYGCFVLSWRAPLYYFMPVLWLSPAVALGACRLTESSRRGRAAPIPPEAEGSALVSAPN
ncbi:MAG: hypothetical protein WBA31_09230 [Candidatus Dormiibacterota bacterium]